MNPSYREFVEAQVHHNPCLIGLADFLSTTPHKPYDNVQVSCLDFSTEGGANAVERRLTLDECLSDIYCAIDKPSGMCMRRILLVEDISPYAVEQLGTLLDIDPMYFAAYISTSFAGIAKAPPCPSIALLPSRFASDDSLHLHYQRVIKIPYSAQYPRDLYSFKSFGNISRSVRRLTSVSGTEPALMRSCCSVLLKVLNEESWICVVLVDSTDADLVLPVTSTKNKEQHYKRIPQVPLQGGFENFEQVRKYSEFCSSATDDSEPRKPSLLKSIVHYYRNSPPGFDPAKPSIMALSFYPLKIVAAEWMVYTLLMNCYVKFYEYSIQSRELRSIETDIVDLQRWRRRGKQSLQKLHLVELFMAKQLGLQPTIAPSNDNVLSNNAPYTTLLDDFRYLSTQIEHYSRSLEFMLPVAATMMQLTDARRSIKEATYVRYLTYIALVFVPLTFVSSLFSMQEGFLPGQVGFGVYAAVALPLVVVVLTFSLVTSIDFRDRWRKMSRKRTVG